MNRSPNTEQISINQNSSELPGCLCATQKVPQLRRRVCLQCALEMNTSFPWYIILDNISACVRHVTHKTIFCMPISHLLGFKPSPLLDIPLCIFFCPFSVTFWCYARHGNCCYYVQEFIVGQPNCLSLGWKLYLQVIFPLLSKT